VHMVSPIISFTLNKSKVHQTKEAMVRLEGHRGVRLGSKPNRGIVLPPCNLVRHRLRVRRCDWRQHITLMALLPIWWSKVLPTLAVRNVLFLMRMAPSHRGAKLLHPRRCPPEVLAQGFLFFQFVTQISWHILLMFLSLRLQRGLGSS